MAKYIEDYYKAPCAHHQRMKELIAKLQLKGDEKVLDVGCGDGRLSAKIATQLTSGSVVGIDISEEIVEFAQTQFTCNDYPNLKFQCIDANKLDWENEFDIIVSFGSVHYIVDQINLMKRFKQSLTAYGKLLLSFTCESNSNNNFTNVLKELIDGSKWKHTCKKSELNYGFYPIEQYRLFLEEVGFKVESIDLYKFQELLNGKQGVKEYIRNNWLSLTSRIPDTFYKDFIEDIINIYIERNPPNKEGFILYKESWLEVEAIKI